MSSDDKFVPKGLVESARGSMIPVHAVRMRANIGVHVRDDFSVP